MKKLILPALLLSGICAFAAPKKSMANHIRCSETMDDESGNWPQVGSLTIQLDANGNATTISYLRKRTKTNPAINLQLNKNNAVIIHDIQLNRVEEIDEETKEPIYAWGIKDVETIDAKSASMGIELNIKINDHSYSGVPGSLITLKSKSLNLPHENESVMTHCEGKLRVISK